MTLSISKSRVSPKYKITNAASINLGGDSVEWWSKIRSVWKIGRHHQDDVSFNEGSTPPPQGSQNGHVYFLPASLALGKEIIYFVKVKEKVEKKYIVLDMVHDKISFSDELSTTPSLQHFSIVEVTSENILPKDAVWLLSTTKAAPRKSYQKLVTCY